MSKTALRAYYKKWRQTLTFRERHVIEQRILAHWQQGIQGFAGKRIGSYLATPHECPTQAIHQHLWQNQAHVYIPLISQASQWGRLTASSPLIHTPMGVMEPQASELAATATLDLILLPLLAIDQQGYRLGYGKGFYDRLLAQPNPGPVLIGLGFQHQLVPTLPHEAWDIPAHGFLSEQGWLFFSHTQSPIQADHFAI